MLKEKLKPTVESSFRRSAPDDTLDHFSFIESCFNCPYYIKTILSHFNYSIYSHSHIIFHLVTNNRYAATRLHFTISPLQYTFIIS